MKAALTSILILLALCLGWFLGKQVEPSAENDSEISKGVSSRSPSTGSRRPVAQKGIITSGSNRIFLASLNESLTGITLDEIEGLKKEQKSRSRPDWAQGQMAFNLLYERWTELDPEGALASALRDDLGE